MFPIIFSHPRDDTDTHLKIHHRLVWATTVEMGTFKSVGQQATLLETVKPSEEAEYWTSAFERPPFVRKELGQITNVAFSPDVNFPTYALSCGTRVNIHGEPPEWNRTKSLTVFPLPVYGGHFRHDGRLFVCACEDGIVRTFDMSTGTLLRQFTGHKMAVHACAFSRDGLKVGSAGDDRSVFIWDLSVGQPITSFTEHSDYARCILPMPNDSSLWISASYDKTVKFYDARMQKSVRSIECSSIVEDIALNQTGVSLAVACDRAVYMWDTVSPSDKPMACLQHHHKTVTSLCYASKGSFLLSASLDKHINVFDMDPVASYSVVTTLDQPNPIVKVVVSPDDRHLLVALADNRLSISSRKQEVKTAEVLKVGHVRPNRYFERVLNNVPAQEARPNADGVDGSKVSVVNTKSDLHLLPTGSGPMRYYDKMLRQFEHSKALTNVMKDAFRKQNCEVAVSLIDELIRRGVLRAALAGRPENWVSQALRFAGQQYHHVAFQRVLSEFVNAVIDIYGDALLGSKNPELRSAFRYVSDVVDTEWDVKFEANELAGAVECLLNQS